MIQKLNPINKIFNLPLYPLKNFFIFLKKPMPVDTFEGSIIDIHSKKPFPSCVLSNFCKSKFKLDGVKINSMEGFLQSLKTPDEKLQKKVCKLIGKEAKLIGNSLNESGFDRQHLYWKGKTIDRYSDEYQNLLKRAYDAKFRSDPLFRAALSATKGKTLAHSIGLQRKEETILTEKEFIRFLNQLRDRL